VVFSPVLEARFEPTTA